MRLGRLKRKRDVRRRSALALDEPLEADRGDRPSPGGAGLNERDDHHPSLSERLDGQLHPSRFEAELLGQGHEVDRLVRESAKKAEDGGVQLGAVDRCIPSRRNGGNRGGIGS